MTPLNIPLSSPSITERERTAVLDVLSGGTLSRGPRLLRFEKAFADRMGSRHAVAVNSGTSGLHLAVKAAEIGPGDEVITTPFSFVASANCILYEGGTPVFVDVQPATFNLDPTAVGRAVSSRTRAILPVHVFGRPCDLAPILRLAQQKHLTVIEDACEAIGATYQGRPVGTFGHTGVFAFYPNKQITTGEGGMIVTGDQRVAALCRSWRNQGRDESSEWPLHERLGYNYRLSDINCALGIAQLTRLDDLLVKRARIANHYTEILADLVPEVIPPAPAAPGTDISWFVYVVRLRDEFPRAHRDGVLEHLRKCGIGCSNYFTPIHLQPFYRQQFGYAPGDFPVTERIADHTIALPFFSDLTRDQIATVCKTLAAGIRCRDLDAAEARESAHGIGGLSLAVREAAAAL